MTRFPASLTVISLLTMTLGSAGLANATMSVTNHDAYERTVLIKENRREAKIYGIQIAPDETIEGLCEDGCTVALENGTQERFEGYEQVYIFKGQLTWSP